MKVTIMSVFHHKSVVKKRSSSCENSLSGAGSPRNNPYSQRGLNVFAATKEELQARRAALATKTGVSLSSILFTPAAADTAVPSSGTAGNTTHLVPFFISNPAQVEREMTQKKLTENGSTSSSCETKQKWVQLEEEKEGSAMPDQEKKFLWNSVVTVASQQTLQWLRKNPGKAGFAVVATIGVFWAANIVALAISMAAAISLGGLFLCSTTSPSNRLFITTAAVRASPPAEDDGRHPSLPTLTEIITSAMTTSPAPSSPRNDIGNLFPLIKAPHNAKPAPHTAPNSPSSTSLSVNFDRCFSSPSSPSPSYHRNRKLVCPFSKFNSLIRDGTADGKTPKKSTLGRISVTGIPSSDDNDIQPQQQNSTLTAKSSAHSILGCSKIQGKSTLGQLPITDPPSSHSHENLRQQERSTLTPRGFGHSSSLVSWIPKKSTPGQIPITAPFSPHSRYNHHSQQQQLKSTLTTRILVPSSWIAIALIGLLFGNTTAVIFLVIWWYITRWTRPDPRLKYPLPHTNRLR